MESDRKRLISVLAFAIAIVLAFLVGYIPEAMRLRMAHDEGRQASERLSAVEAKFEKAQFDLDVARLRGQLGEVLQDAVANNFSVAAQRATVFFDDLRKTMNNRELVAGSPRRQVLDSTLARRDEISADLARADQGVKAKLAQMYMQFGGAVE